MLLRQAMKRISDVQQLLDGKALARIDDAELRSEVRSLDARLSRLEERVRWLTEP